MSKRKILTGQEFGHLTVLGPGPLTPFNQSKWICRCKCGREVIRRSDHLKPGKNHSCGECQAPRTSRTKAPKATLLPVTPPTTTHTITDPASPADKTAPPQTSEQEPSSLSGLLDETTAAIDALLCHIEALSTGFHRVHEMLLQLHAMLAPSHPNPPATSPPFSLRNNNPAYEQPRHIAAPFPGLPSPVNGTHIEGELFPGLDEILALLDLVPDTPSSPTSDEPAQLIEDNPAQASPPGSHSSSHDGGRNNGTAIPTLSVLRLLSAGTSNTQHNAPRTPEDSRYHTRPSLELVGHYDSFLSTNGQTRPLGTFPNELEARFAGEAAVLLQQILTPSQRQQSCILLEPSQLAQVKLLESVFSLDGAKKHEIKEDVALQFLDAHQELIW